MFHTSISLWNYQSLWFCSHAEHEAEQLLWCSQCHREFNHRIWWWTSWWRGSTV